MSIPQQIIRPARLTSKIATWQGEVSAESLPRLADELVAPFGNVRWRVTAVATGGGQSKIHCIITGLLHLAVSDESAKEFPLELERTIRLVPNEALLPPIEDEPEDEDFIVAPESLDVVELVEEEVLLSLPPVLDDSILSHAEQSQKPSPFAALADLKSLSLKNPKAN